MSKYTEIEISKESYRLFMEFKQEVTCGGKKNIDEDGVFQHAMVLAKRQLEKQKLDIAAYSMLPKTFEV